MSSSVQIVSNMVDFAKNMSRKTSDVVSQEGRGSSRSDENFPSEYMYVVSRLQDAIDANWFDLSAHPLLLSTLAFFEEGRHLELVEMPGEKVGVKVRDIRQEEERRFKEMDDRYFCFVHF